MAEVLLIDAEQPFAGEVKSSLEGRGFSVTQLDDGKEGLEHARANKPDLIVLCVELPKMSGYSICNKLKKDGELKQIPLIITSSEATPETFAQHKKLKTRAEDYLIKPFELDALVEKIGGQVELPAAEPPPPPAEEDEGDLEGALGALDELGGDEVQLEGGALDDLKIESAEAPSEPEQVDALPDEESLDLGELGGDDNELLGGLEESGGSDDDLLAGLDDGGGGDDDDLLAALDGDSGLGELGGGDEGGLDQLDASGGDDELPDFDAAFEEIEPEPEPAEAQPEPEPEPAPAAEAQKPAGGGAADLAAMNQLRRENTDLKATVKELEHRLKAAEENAKAAKDALDSAKSGSSSSARETLELKKEIRNKEKELMELKDEIFQKEEAVVEVSEELEKVKAAAEEAQTGVAAKDAEIAKLNAKVEALTEERDSLEAQVGERLQTAEAENEELKGRNAELESKLAEAEKQVEAVKGETEERINALERENKETGEQLVQAYNRIKTEESLRDKAKDAVQIAMALLSGDVEDGNEAGLEQHSLDA